MYTYTTPPLICQRWLNGNKKNKNIQCISPKHDECLGNVSLIKDREDLKVAELRLPKPINTSLRTPFMYVEIL